MSSIVEVLRERVTQTQADLERAKEITSMAMSEQTALEEQLEAYTSALRFEERRNGVPGPKKPSASDPPTEAVPERSNDASINKSLELIRIMQSHKEGIAPLDLHSELNEKGVEIGTNYVYGLLYKLKKRGEIRKRGRKFFWVESEETRAAS